MCLYIFIYRILEYSILGWLQYPQPIIFATLVCSLCHTCILWMLNLEMILRFLFWTATDIRVISWFVYAHDACSQWIVIIFITWKWFFSQIKQFCKIYNYCRRRRPPNISTWFGTVMLQCKCMLYVYCEILKYWKFCISHFIFLADAVVIPTWSSR